MNKILIVEDEWFTRDSLVHAIDWKSAGFEVAADAEDGREALEMIRLQAPDIVISDIKMDGMDGIELCRHINRDYPDIRVILVTGHSEFEYAQQALKLGVKDFVLKPTDPAELLGTVERIAGEIENGRRRQEEYLRLQTVVEENIPFLQERFILELAGGRIFEAKELDQRKEFLGMSFENFTFVAMEIDDYEEFLDNNNEKQRQIIKLMIRDIACKILQARGSGHFIEKETNQFLLFVQCTDIVELAEELQQKISDEVLVPLSMGISEPFSSVECLNTAYQQSVEALRQKFYIGCKCIVYYKDLKIDSASGCKPVAGEQDGLLEHMMNGVRAGDRQGALNDLEKIFNRLQEYKSEKSVYTKNIAFEIVIFIQRLLLDLNENPSDLLPVTNILTGIAGCKTLQEIKALIEGYTGSAADLVNRRNQMLGQSVVNKIVEHLNCHFRRNISLEDLGNIAHMNPKYVCRLIKKETGSNFSDILLGIRVEKAKELLRRPDMRTYEIAEMVGFEDSGYFSKVFKKYTGITPTEYKQQFV